MGREWIIAGVLLFGAWVSFALAAITFPGLKGGAAKGAPGKSSGKGGGVIGGGGGSKGNVPVAAAFFAFAFFLAITAGGWLLPTAAASLTHAITGAGMIGLAISVAYLVVGGTLLLLAVIPDSIHSRITATLALVVVAAGMPLVASSPARAEWGEIPAGISQQVLVIADYGRAQTAGKVLR